MQDSKSEDNLYEELEQIRGCWNIYVDDDGNRYPNCPMCTEDVKLEWEYCLNCGYPKYDFDADEVEDENEQEAAPVRTTEDKIDWRKGGF